LKSKANQGDGSTPKVERLFQNPNSGVSERVFRKKERIVHVESGVCGGFRKETETSLLGYRNQ
jgi:hypothetical protein